MTLDQARKLALALPEAVESSHMGHPDFRVHKKIFASFDRGRVVVKLTPEQQLIMTEAEPDIFTPIRGGWGNQGWTAVDLKVVDKLTMRSALRTAWRNVAPKSLIVASHGAK